MSLIHKLTPSSEGCKSPLHLLPDLGRRLFVDLFVPSVAAGLRLVGARAAAEGSIAASVAPSGIVVAAVSLVALLR